MSDAFDSFDLIAGEDEIRQQEEQAKADEAKAKQAEIDTALAEREDTKAKAEEAERAKAEADEAKAKADEVAQQADKALADIDDLFAGVDDLGGEISAEAQNLSNKQSATKEFEKLPDDVEIAFGEHKLKKADVKALAARQKEIHAEHEFISSMAQTLRDTEAKMEAIQQRSLSEVDRQLDALRTAVQDPNITDAQRGAYYRQLQEWQKKGNALQIDIDHARQVQETKKAELMKVRIHNTDSKMREVHGDAWAQNAGAVYNFAIQMGMTPDDIKASLSPALAQIFIMARKFQAIDAQRKQKLQETLSKNAPAVQEVDESDKLDKFKEKAKRQKVSRDDLMSIFDQVSFK